MSVSVRPAADGLRARVGGAWTRDKLTYLRKYAAGFMTAMAPKRAAGRWERLVYIDPLCGPGIDIDTTEFPGSPLIALQTQPQFDRIFLGDANRLNVAALRQRIPPADSARVSIERRDCHERVREVVGEISRKSLGLAFVDPQGFEVRFELFRTLAARSVDILFLFPSGIGIVRNLRAFVRQQHSPMDDLWGSRAWRQTPIARLLAGTALPTLDERLDQSWVRAFCDRVATLGFTHYDAVGPLSNDQGAPMYHLLFFSRHNAGLTIWRGIGRINPRGQRALF